MLAVDKITNNLIYMNKFLNWFAVSSVNSEEWAMSLKGLIITNAGLIVWLLHLLNVNITVQQITELAGLSASFLGSAILTAGLLRKIWYTFKK